MFGLGFSELILVAVALLLFVKPKELPKLLRGLGRIYGSIQRSYYTLTHELMAMDDEDKGP